MAPHCHQNHVTRWHIYLFSIQPPLTCGISFPHPETQCSKYSKLLSVTKPCSLSPTSKLLNLDFGEGKKPWTLGRQAQRTIARKLEQRLTLPTGLCIYCPLHFLLQPFHLVNFHFSLN